VAAWRNKPSPTPTSKSLPAATVPDKSAQSRITIRLHDNSIHRAQIPADSEGRLHIELDGNDRRFTSAQVSPNDRLRTIEQRGRLRPDHPPTPDRRPPRVRGFYHAIENTQSLLAKEMARQSQSRRTNCHPAPDGDATGSRTLLRGLLPRSHDENLRQLGSYDYVGASASSLWRKSTARRAASCNSMPACCSPINQPPTPRIHDRTRRWSRRPLTSSGLP